MIICDLLPSTQRSAALGLAWSHPAGSRGLGTRFGASDGPSPALMVPTCTEAGTRVQKLCITRIQGISASLGGTGTLPQSTALWLASSSARKYPPPKPWSRENVGKPGSRGYTCARGDVITPLAGPGQPAGLSAQHHRPWPGRTPSACTAAAPAVRPACCQCHGGLLRASPHVAGTGKHPGDKSMP